MSRRALQAAVPAGARRERPGGAGWLGWLLARLDPAWRAGEWDGGRLLFTGDLASAWTAAWPCRTPGCPTATRRPSGRCDGCRRARVSTGLTWAEFDSAPPPRATRPLQRGRCAVPDCEGDLHCAGLCFRHERSWGKNRSDRSRRSSPAPVRWPGPPGCRVAGCDRESITHRRLCRFHDQRLRRQRTVAAMSDEELAFWAAARATPAGGAPVLAGRAAGAAAGRAALCAAAA